MLDANADFLIRRVKAGAKQAPCVIREHEVFQGSAPCFTARGDFFYSQGVKFARVLPLSRARTVILQ